MALTYDPIATNTLGSATATVTFSSIPSTYTDLVLVMTVKAATADANVNIKINSDTSTNYSRTYMYGDGTSAISGRVTSASTLGIFTADTTNFTPGIVQFMNYANTTTFKTIIQRTGITYPATQAGLWRKTPEAINTLDISLASGNMASGSTFTLYGIKAA